MLKTYALLTKPGIIFGNLITMAAAFLLGSKGGFDLPLFLFTFVGLGCIIASACVCNNVIDREADAKMQRTQGRVLVQGKISGKQALVFAALLGVIGAALLFWKSGLAAFWIALLGFVIYVVFYSFWKYRTRFATLVGSVAGAIPPVVGYLAATKRFDLGALLLFLLLVFWQMPHFFAIALYRMEDYAAASIPVLPIEKGVFWTKVEMFCYTIAFCIVALLLHLTGYASFLCLMIGAVGGLGWALLSIAGFRTKNDCAWAKNMFRYSLLLIVALSISMSV